MNERLEIAGIGTDLVVREAVMLLEPQPIAGAACRADENGMPPPWSSAIDLMSGRATSACRSNCWGAGDRDHGDAVRPAVEHRDA